MISERKRISFEFVADVTKQLTAVAAALVGLSITFRQDLLKGLADVPRLLQAAVVLYVLTVITGLYVLLALTGSLGREPEEVVATDDEAHIASKIASNTAGQAAPRTAPKAVEKQPRDNDVGIPDEKLSIYRKSIRAPFFALLVFFLFAVLTTVAFGWTQYGVPAKPATAPGYAFARATLRSGMRCVVAAPSDAEAAACARRASTLAFRYTPPPAVAASFIAALDAAAAASDSGAKARKGASPALSARRLRTIDAYLALDSLMAEAQADSGAALTR